MIATGSPDKPRLSTHLGICTRWFVALLMTAIIGPGSIGAAAAADQVVLRVGDQKGGNRSLLEISGLASDLPYKIEWAEFPAAAPILEALNAGALDVGYTGDLAFLSVYATGAPSKAIGGTRSDPRTQAILVRNDSPIKTVADLKGKRLAGTRGGWGQFLIDATLEKTGYDINAATFAPLGPVDAKIALLAGSIDGWAVWEPYVSYATLKDNARVVADGQGLTPTVTFIVASDAAIATKRAALQDFVHRLNKARLWSLEHVAEYAKNTAELTKLPEDVLLSAYKAQRTTPIAIDDAGVKEVQEAADRATRFGILSKQLDVSKLSTVASSARSFPTSDAEMPMAPGPTSVFVIDIQEQGAFAFEAGRMRSLCSSRRCIRPESFGAAIWKSTSNSSSLSCARRSDRRSSTLSSG
jgi:sulfonate transport system substrate-binding protein